tara:strand:- start:141 stop:854 length:714 start_codon:yes stop_codon:yes gene_type:complete
MIKRLLKAGFVQKLATWLVAGYIRFVRLSGRWQVVGEGVPDELLEREEPFIVAFWHERLLMMSFSWKKSDLVHILISGHRDGQLISGMLTHFGSKTVFGSSTRGGTAAFIQLTRLLKEGKVVGITPDGPRGPRREASKGVIALAKVTGAPIVPLTYSASFSHVFGSWDHFMLPLPFSRGLFLWGKPIYVRQDADSQYAEEKRTEVEQALIALTQRADWLMGLSEACTEGADSELHRG